jgi:hypothetical protein
MPSVALSPGWGSFVAFYTLVRFTVNGEWAVGSMLVAETWPARLPCSRVETKSEPLYAAPMSEPLYAAPMTADGPLPP